MRRIEKSLRLIREKESRKPLEPITKTEMSSFESFLRQKFLETNHSDKKDQEKEKIKIKKEGME